MLQLLLERGQSYADLAALLGVDEAEVRARARAALTELGGADPDRDVGLTDYLLGQADPIGRADAVRHLKENPDDLALATEIAQKARLIAPEAELPRLPGEERQPRPRRERRLPLSRLPVPSRLRRGRPAEQAPAGAPGGKGPATTPGRRTFSKRQTQLFVGLGSGAVLLVMIVLGVTGAFSSGNDDDTTPSTTGTTANAANAGPQGFPLTQVKIDKSGDFQDSFAIPRGYQALLPRTQAIYVTLAEAKRVLSSIKTAIDNREPLRVEGKTAFAGVVNSASARKNVIPIPLQAGKGVQGSGAAALGLASGNQPFFDLKLTGLEQAPQGSAYIVWFVIA
jgi:hypothetical protein